MLEASEKHGLIGESEKDAKYKKTFSKTPDSSIAEKVEFGESLAPLEVYRDGPRFYCAWVSDGESEFQIKDVVHNPEVNNNHDNLNSPSAHLITEIEMARFLDSKAADIPQIAPHLILANVEGEPWYTSEHLREGWLGMDVSPFFYNLENLRAVDPASVFNGIEVLQQLSDDPDVPDWLTREDRAQTNNPNVSTSAISYLSERSECEAEKITRAYVKALEVRKQQPRVLKHGEVYPPHIFVQEGDEHAQFIDWENASLGDPYSDHTAVWLRAFEEPEWQEKYYELVSSQESFDQDGWNASVFLTAFGNFQYLAEWDQMDASRREPAAEYCKYVALEMTDALLD